ncbi:type II toxin-antitoxin system PemK/MazF family toxin [Bradyrhizobium cajani]|uniref:type II toxin-antitoxin system PemK/MazF family toxin n=1 Tax=Bradyrhizobium cajani TaxID=1928661 RepID=UPI00197AD4FE|nr:type II toxin-antitoxin system PemK/MazF family toxin [Bradyrhizobium cajani]MCP3373059.1 type II toxin-antitoxin system PemK/MazF family toxin [Bradyrhizobium cajani]
MATKSGDYCPDAGDVIWIDLDPTVGHEQSGRRRPVMVVSPRSYNAVAGLCVICPITSRVRGYPFEAALPEGASVRGVVLADQPRSISWEKRPITLAGRAPDMLRTEVRERLAALLGID